jgi:ABC-type methionine transport system ATPase subunit
LRYGICARLPAAEGEVVALDDLSLTIEKGDIYGIIGMSGGEKARSSAA